MFAAKILLSNLGTMHGHIFWWVVQNKDFPSLSSASWRISVKQQQPYVDANTFWHAPSLSTAQWNFTCDLRGPLGSALDTAASKLFKASATKCGGFLWSCLFFTWGSYLFSATNSTEGSGAIPTPWIQFCTYLGMVPCMKNSFKEFVGPIEGLVDVGRSFWMCCSRHVHIGLGIAFPGIFMEYWQLI